MDRSDTESATPRTREHPARPRSATGPMVDLAGVEIRPGPEGRRGPGGPSLRLDSGHAHPGGERPGERQRARRRAGRPPVRSLGAPAWSADPRAGCVLASSERESRAVAAIVNWVVADHLGGAELVDGGGDPTGPSPVRLEAAGGDLAGYLLVPADPGPAPGIAGVPAGFRPSVVERYSLDPGCDWWAGDVRSSVGRFRFRAFHRGDFRMEVRLAACGESQILPALAALAVGSRLGMKPGLIRERLEDFSGGRRRFESRGHWRGVTLVDDDAQGDRGVAVALDLARAVFGRRTLRAVFLAEDRSSTPRLATEAFVRADEFAAADHLILVGGGGVRAESTRLLAARLRSSGASVVLCSTLSGAIQELDRTLGPGDVLVTLGADEVGTIADALLRRLPRDRHCC